MHECVGSHPADERIERHLPERRLDQCLECAGSIGGFEVAVADRAKRLERIDAGEVVEISERIDARTHAAAGGDVVDDRHRVAGDLARAPSLAR